MKKCVFMLAITLLLSFGFIEINDYEPEKIQPIEKNEAVSIPVSEEPVEIPEKITISLVGDMMFAGSVGRVVNLKGEDYLFEGYSKHFKESDIVLGNLETAISHRGMPMEDKEYTFRSSPKMAAALKRHNFTAVSIANNHVLDYGYEAFDDTLKNLEDNGILYAGGGKNKEEAQKGIFIEKNGIKVGFIAFSRVVPVVDWYAGSKKPGIIGAYKVHEAEVLELLENLKTQCDILVVSVHWGKEHVLEAREQEMETARKMIDAGADIIMGHHPHVVQGIEMYNGKPIFYSLGNFIFSTSRLNISNKTVMAKVAVNSKGEVESVRVVPGTITEGRPLPMDEKQAAEFMEHLDRFNINFKLSGDV